MPSPQPSATSQPQPSRAPFLPLGSSQGVVCPREPSSLVHISCTRAILRTLAERHERKTFPDDTPDFFSKFAAGPAAANPKRGAVQPPP